MQLSASDYYTFLRPSKCELRVYLRAKHEQESEPSEFDKLIQDLGQRHEKEHLATLGSYEDISSGTLSERLSATSKAITAGKKIIYQGVMQSTLPSSKDLVTGIPDLIIRDGDGYIIRDCKISRHADEDHHQEIILQLELYGWLFEQSFGKPPKSLQVYLGDKMTVAIPYTDGSRALESLGTISAIAGQELEPYSPVGWTKCGACGFKDRCWKNAEASDDVALVFGVDQATAVALRDAGASTSKELLSRFTKESLATLKKHQASRTVSIGKAAERIILQAQALQSGKEELLHSIPLPTQDNMVMFDLEGLPPEFDDLDKVYLWGMQVYGKNPGSYQPALASFGAKGDEQGWSDFLDRADAIFSQYGDIPFIHWAHYETTKVKTYIKRYGDPKGIAARVLTNCVDLLPITRDALVLPDYSYSLKVVEKHAGFVRTMKDYGGDWSIAQYIKAVETNDQDLRQKIMSDIIKYNEEDLKATWAVLQWLNKKQVS